MKMRYLALLIASSIVVISISILFKNDSILMALGIFVSVGVSFKILYEMMVSIRKGVEKKAEVVEEETREIQNMRSEFVANVSHELKTPLTSISGFIETLQAGAIEDEKIRDRFINIIAEETNRLKRLIDDILVLSDIENLEEKVIEEIKIHKIVNQITEFLCPILENKNVKIINEVKENVTIKGNSDRFQQMMLNLIENGIKYGKPNGNVWINATENDDEITISVRDDGIGIAEKELNRITERFYRVDKSRSNVVGGTGLGLSIVKHTAMMFGGTLEIASKLNEGSIFTIRILKNKN